MRILSSIGVAVLAFAAARALPPNAAVAPAPPASTHAEIAGAALDGVVLLVGTRADGKLAYGAGIVVGARGEVLTSAHVIRGLTNLRGMLRDRARPGYTVLDGGLARYLTERGDALVSVEEIDVDPAADLAVVRLATSTANVPRPALRATALLVGERVEALGHPGENVWALSSGVVAALPHGAIQHDAALGEGSSGGPLLDAEGRLVGIDVARVTSGAERIGYARPASAILALLVRSAVPVLRR